MEEDNNSFDNDNARYSDDYGARLRREVQEMRNERKLAEKNAKQMELHLQILQNENQSNIKQVETCKLKAMKRLRYIETFVLTQKKKNELKEQRFKELQTLRKQNNYIRTSLHNSIDIKRKDFFNKTNEEGLLSYTMKEYFKELRTFNKNEELMKNKQTVYTIRNRTSNYKQKKHNDLITKKMREIQYLEDLLVTEFKNKEQAEVNHYFVNFEIEKK